MKIKNVRNQLSASVLAICLALSVTCIPAFAEQCPVKIPAPGSATVSEELDMTGYNDHKIGTDFWMYIPPDPDTVVKDYPPMGDEGFSSTGLMLGAIVTGIVYLGLSVYANSNNKRLNSQNVQKP